MQLKNGVRPINIICLSFEIIFIWFLQCKIIKKFNYISIWRDSSKSQDYIICLSKMFFLKDTVLEKSFHPEAFTYARVSPNCGNVNWNMTIKRCYIHRRVSPAYLIFLCLLLPWLILLYTTCFLICPKSPPSPALPSLMSPKFCLFCFCHCPILCHLLPACPTSL